MSEQPVVTGDVATPVVSGAGIRGVGLTPEEKAVFVELMVKYTLDQGLEADREDLSSLNSVSRARARGRTAVRRYDHLTSHWADD